MECNFGSGEQCEFLEKKLPMKIPKLVFPYEVEHFKKPLALRSLLGAIESLNYQFRLSDHHYAWIDNDSKALSILHGCSSKQIDALKEESNQWNKHELLIGA